MVGSLFNAFFRPGSFSASLLPAFRCSSVRGFRSLAHFSTTSLSSTSRHGTSQVGLSRASMLLLPNPRWLRAAAEAQSVRLRRLHRSDPELRHHSEVS